MCFALQVRKAAQVTLLVLMDQSLVGQSAVEEVVCPVVNVLSESDQYPVNAVQVRHSSDWFQLLCMLHWASVGCLCMFGFAFCWNQVEDLEDNCS